MGWSQIFLKITFDGAGLVAGESETVGYEKQIVLADFDWEMSAGKDVLKGTGAGRTNTRRVNASELTLKKRFDSSSTTVMSAMSKRDRIKTARVTVAQSFAVEGGSVAPRDAFVLEVENAYIEAIDLDLVPDGKAMVLQESITIRYSKLKIEVVPVNANGTYSKVRSTFISDVQDSMGLLT